MRCAAAPSSQAVERMDAWPPSPPGPTRPPALRADYQLNIMDHNTESPLEAPQGLVDLSRVSIWPGLRTMDSHGQLARSWNEGLTVGFKNLSAPAHDFVVLMQADAALKPGWVIAIRAPRRVHL